MLTSSRVGHAASISVSLNAAGLSPSFYLSDLSYALLNLNQWGTQFLFKLEEVDFIMKPMS